LLLLLLLLLLFSLALHPYMLLKSCQCHWG
jgi:hypothetical protein